MVDQTRILYIDDQPADCQSARAVLEPIGRFNITWVKSIADLSEQMLIDRYDLVVSETAPFHLDELKILEIVLSRNPGIPIVIFTRDERISTAVAALKHGAADYLVKSADAFRSLPQKLGEVLADYQNLLTRSNPLFHPGIQSLIQPSEILQDVNFRYEFQPIPHFSYVKRATSPASELPAENQPLPKDSSLVWVEVRTHPDYDDARKVIAIEGQIRNITPAEVSDAQLAVYSNEIVRKNQELAEARDKALEASQLKSDYLAMMSHDIRTPINAITGMTELLLDTPLNQEQREYAEVVKDSTRVLLELINDILDFSKIEAGKLGLEIIEFEPLEIIEGVGEMFAAQARRKGVELTEFVSPRIPTRLRGDPVRLRQVLMNLVSNAVKFTDHGEIAIRVDPVEETGDYTMLLFQVRDTGIGIPEDSMDQIFQPFIQATASTTRRYGGTGLGLAISKRLVELMDGDISVDSLEGAGSTFWFTAFFKKSPLPEVKEAVPAGPSLPATLIISPSSTLRNNLQAYLAMKDIPNEGTPDLDTALMVLRVNLKKRFPIVILDQDLDQPDAMQAIQSIHELPEFAGAHLILMIPYDQRRKAEQALQAGHLSYLIKPVKRSDFFETLIRASSAKPAGPAPAEAEARPAAAQPVETPAAAAPKPQAASERVLLAEDDPTSQRLATIQLEKLGYAVDVVENGTQAVKAILETPGRYELMLIDCQMPELDGYAATRQIRQAEAAHGSYTPIIAMTANAVKGDRENCLAAGMDDYVSKPVSMETLKQITQKWIKHLGPALQTTAALPTKNTGSLNPDKIKEICSMQEPGKPDFLTELIDIYLRDSWALMEKIQRAADEDDAYVLKRAIHSLKGASSNLGATYLVQTCGEVELLLEDKKMESALPRLRDIETEYQRFRQALIARRTVSA